jgi:ADP-ribose pyrophosphatase YjhB (NUDIX family)
MKQYRNPVPTVDIIIEIIDKNNKNSSENKIVLIRRKNPPYGWALPGGFVDYDESLENAALREAKEETSLDVKLIRQFHTYSEPGRDPRQHTISTVYIAKAFGVPEGMDDAEDAKIFDKDNIPGDMAFDHKKILDDYFMNKY